MRRHDSQLGWSASSIPLRNIRCTPRLHCCTANHSLPLYRICYTILYTILYPILCTTLYPELDTILYTLQSGILHTKLYIPCEARRICSAYLGEDKFRPLFRSEGIYFLTLFKVAYLLIVLYAIRPIRAKRGENCRPSCGSGSTSSWSNYELRDHGTTGPRDHRTMRPPNPPP